MVSGHHLLNIINDLLDMSKLEAGRLKIDSIPFDLIANVNESLDFVKESARAKGLNLTVVHDPELPDWVKGDPRRLCQILVNLLGNAVKFTREGSVKLAIHPVNDQICFSVTDTGIGIDNSQIPQLFKTFEQADTTNARQFGGSGLGLAISLNLAKQMGGTITAEGEPGQGSTFTLWLPLTKTQPSEHHADRETLPAGARLAGLSVLGVEDDEFNRMVLKEMLEYEGATLVLAENGQQALDRLVEAGPTTFDVVIMDVQMPVMDGYEATQRIHKIDPDLPVIGLTAHAMPEERGRCLSAGMATHITKPLDINHLVTVLIQHLPISQKQEIHALQEMAMHTRKIEKS
jgi:CheY-like chemotaxis protein